VKRKDGRLEKLYSVEEAAEALRISKWTVACWLSKGVLRRTKCGARTLIRESELQRVIQDGGKSLSPRQPEATL
jgi:excisionase family DNA binding protein